MASPNSPTVVTRSTKRTRLFGLDTEASDRGDPLALPRPRLGLGFGGPSKRLPDLEGRLLDGRYRMAGLLGSGGMGAVFEATHVRIQRRFAIKVMRSTVAHREGFTARFMREARAASLVRHPNVVEMFDFGEFDDGSVYSVMEFLDGEDLGALLRREKTMTWARAQPLLREIAAALHVAHCNGVIHRDVKPGNCFVVRAADGRAEHIKVVDFGIAKLDEALARGDHPLTAVGQVLGTPAYMAPELARGLLATPLTDVYALGVLAYRMLTGHLPFTGRNAVEMLYEHATAQPKRPREWPADIPPGVEELILAMLAKAPDKRPQGMDAVGRQIERLRPNGDAPPRVVQSGATEKDMPMRRDQPPSALRSASDETPTSPTGIGPTVAVTHAPRAAVGAWAKVRASSLAGLLVALAGMGWAATDGAGITQGAGQSTPAPTVAVTPEPVPTDHSDGLVHGPVLTPVAALAPALAPVTPLAPVVVPDGLGPDTPPNLAPTIADVATPASDPHSSGPASPPQRRGSTKRTPAMDTVDGDELVVTDDLLAPAGLALDQGHRERASALFEEVLELEPDNVEALEGLAELCFDQGRYEESILYARELVQIEPSNATHALALGDALFGAHHYRPARREYERARDLGSSRASTRLDQTRQALARVFEASSDPRISVRPSAGPGSVGAALVRP